MPEAGCEPMVFMEEMDMGCQADLPSDDEDGEEDLNEEEEWCLEQIETAYKHVARAKAGSGRGVVQLSQLAEYEQRQGLTEVRAVYANLMRELGDEPEDVEGGVGVGASTQELLSAYRPVFHAALQRRGERESEVSLLCKEVYTLMQHAPSGLENPIFKEVEAAATFKTRIHKKSQRAFGMVSLLPRGARHVTVHSGSLKNLKNLKEGLKRIVDKAAAKKKNGAPPHEGEGGAPGSASPAHSDTAAAAATAEAWVAVDAKADTEPLAPSQTQTPVEVIGGGGNVYAEVAASAVPASPPKKPGVEVRGTQPCLAKAHGNGVGKASATGGGPTAAVSKTHVSKAAAEAFTDPKNAGRKISLEMCASLDASQRAGMPMDAWQALAAKTAPSALWNEHFAPLLDAMYIAETTDYAARLREVVMNVQEDEMVASQAYYAKERLVRAADMHEPTTEALKKVSADEAMMDCYEELSCQGRGRFPGAAARPVDPAKQKRVDESRRELSESVNAAFRMLDEFKQTTGGVAFAPPHVLTLLVGIPGTEAEITAWLTDLRQRYRLHKPPIAMGDFSACI